jgi:hypothetical protein
MKGREARACLAILNCSGPLVLDKNPGSAIVSVPSVGVPPTETFCLDWGRGALRMKQRKAKA